MEGAKREAAGGETKRPSVFTLLRPFPKLNLTFNRHEQPKTTSKTLLSHDSMADDLELLYATFEGAASRVSLVQSLQEEGREELINEKELQRLTPPSFPFSNFYRMKSKEPGIEPSERTKLGSVKLSTSSQER